MNEMTEKILVALGEIGEEKVKAADSMEKMQQLLEENGVKATPAEIEEALAVGVDMASRKRELGEEDLENVAGGFAVTTGAVLTIIKGAMLVLDVYQTVKFIKETYDAWKNRGTDSSGSTQQTKTTGGNTQTNTNGSKGNQQTNVNGDNNASF